MMKGGDVSLADQGAKNDDQGEGFALGQRERHVERHPVADEIERVRQIGVPA